MAYFTHTPIYAYLPLFMGSWNMQEHLESDLFWFGDGQICGGFPPLCFFVCLFGFAFWRHGTRLATFLIAPSGNSGSLKVTRFLWNPSIPLLHPHPKTLFEIAMALLTISVSFPSKSRFSASFSILLRFGGFWNLGLSHKFTRYTIRMSNGACSAGADFLSFLDDGERSENRSS